MAGNQKSYEQIRQEVAQKVKAAAGTEKATATTDVPGARKSYEQIRQEVAKKHGVTYSVSSGKTAADVTGRDTGLIAVGYNDRDADTGWNKFLSDQKQRQDEQDNQSWFEKVAGWLGNSPDSTLPGANLTTVSKSYADDTSYKEPTDKWSEQQKRDFGFLYLQSPEKAWEYAEKLNNSIAGAEKETQLTDIKEKATSDFWSGAAHTVGSLATAPLGLADYLDNLAEEIGRGTITEKESVTPYEYSQAVTGSISQKLNDKYGTLNEKIPVIGGKGLGDVYGLGNTIVQSAIAASTGGQFGTLVQFFGSAAASGVADAKQRGASDKQALAIGTLEGVAEGLAEMIGVDNLLHIGSSATMRELVMNLAKQGVSEGLEEGITTVLNGFADQLVMQDKSNFNILVRQYTENGMSVDDAKIRAWLDMANDLAFDMLGGFVSGAVHAGPQTAYETYLTSKEMKTTNGGSQREAGRTEEVRIGDRGTAMLASLNGVDNTPEQLVEAKKVAAEYGVDIFLYTEYDSERESYVKNGSIYINTVSETSIESIVQQYVNEQQGSEVQHDDASEAKATLPETANDPQTTKNVTQTAEPVTGNGQSVTGNGQSVTGNGQSVTQNTQNVTAAPLSVAAQLRQEQNLNGGNINGTQQQLTGPTAARFGTAGTGTGAGLLHGSSQWNDGTGAGEPAGSMAGGAGQTAQRKQQALEQQRAAVNRRNYFRSLRLQKVSSADLGIQSGTDTKNIKVVPQEHWDAEMGQLAERIYQETEKQVSYVLGPIQIRGADRSVRNVNGVVYGDKIVIRADHLRLTMEQIADHESYHGRVEYFGDGLNQEIRRHIVETFSKEELQGVLVKYLEAMRGVYNADDAQTGEDFEQIMRQIQEEVFADAYAGINAFGAGADRFTSAVNEKMKQLGLGRFRSQENGVRETNGPPTDTSGQKENTADYGGERFSVSESFATELQTWFDNTTHEERKVSGKRFLVGTTTDTLKSIGVKDYNIYFGGSKIDKIIEGNSSMTLDTIKDAVMLLEEPILIMQSATVKDSIVLFGEVFTSGNKPVMISVLLNPKTKSGEVLDYAVITSAYGRRIGNLQNLIDTSKIYYVNEDKKRTENWLQALRLQLPSAITKFGPIASINDPEQTVKEKSAENAYLTDEEFRERYGLKLPGMKEIQQMYPIENEAESQTHEEPEKLPMEKYSVDDDSDTTDFASVQAAMNAQSKEWNEMYLRNQLGDEGYEKYRAWEKEQQTQKKQESQERTKQRNAEKQATRKSVTKPVAESRPIVAKRELRNTMMNIFSIPDGSRAELGTMIDNYADRLLKNGSLTEDDRRIFFDRMYDAGVMTVPAEDYFSEGREILKGGRVYVPESIRADFGDDWNDIRRRAFSARIYFTSDSGAGGIDMWNQELAEQLPGLFNTEETDMRSILERIVEIAEEGRDEKMSLAEYTAMLAQQEYVSEREFLDNMERQMDWALRTFAEKARLEVNLRNRTGVQIAKERVEHQEMQKRQRDRKELRELQERTLKSLRWLNQNRNRAPEELKAAFDEVLGDIDLYAIGAANEMRWNDRYNATWKDLGQMYKDAMKNDPNFLPSKELEMIVGRLDGSKIEDMDLGALNDLYKAAIGLRTEFYNRNNVISDEMQRLFEEVYTDAKHEIESAPGKYTGKQMEKFLNLDQLTPMNVLQRMGGWDPNGAFYSMAKQLEKGERDMRAYSVKAQQMLQDFLTEHEDWVKKADGQGKDGIWYDVEIPELVALEVGKKPEFGATIKVSMTPAQKVHLYLESKNVDNLRHMTGGRTFADKKLYSEGKRQEALAQGKTVRMAPETVKAIVSNMTDEELELARLLEQYYNSFATQEINRISNILYGYDKAMGRNYAPIYTNESFNKTEFGVFDTTAEGVGSLKGRQHAVNPSYNISAFDAFEKHVDQTARFVGMAIPARNWTTLMNWKVYENGNLNSTSSVIEHKWGKQGEKYITNLITTLQGGDNAKSESVSSIASKLQSNYISAVFGANPSIVLKQLGSIPLASAYLDAKNVPTPGQIKNIDRSLIGKYTQDLEWRTMGYSMPETRQLKENPNWTQTNKFYKFTFGGGAITAMDGWAASTLWPWAENKVRSDFPDLEMGTQEQIQNGESPFYKKVAELFEDALSRSQSVSDEMHQGTLRKSKNPITRTFTMFRSDSAQAYNALRQKIGEAQYYARTGAKDKVQTASKKAIGAVVCAMLMNAIWSEAVSFLMALWKNKGKYYRDDEDELTAESVIGEMGRNIMGSIMGTVTFGDEIAQLIGNAITGDRRYDLEAPGLEQINEIFNLVQDLLQGNFGRISEAADVVKNGGDLGKYFGDNSGEILGEIKDAAIKVATYFGLSVNNVEAYLLGALKWISPELGAAYDDLFSNVGKGDLSGLSGGALESRVNRILSGRNVSEAEETAQALAALYEAGYKAAVPSDTPTSVTIDGEKYTLGTYQKQAYETVWNGVVADALDDIVSSDAFTRADDEEQAKILKRLYDYAAEQAKAELFENFEISSTTERIKESLKTGLELAECFELEGAELDDYLEMVEGGLKSDLAYELTQELAELVPLPGEDEVQDVQEWRMCVEFSANVGVQLAALCGRMSDKQFAKVKMAYDFGIDPDSYVAYYEIREQYDEDGNGSFTNAEAKAVVDSISGLDTQQRAALWQIVTGNTSAKNNPYSKDVGQKVLDAKASKE